MNSSWNWLDWVLILILAWSVLSGLRRGFVRIVAALAGALVGVLAGLWFYGVAAAYLLPFIRPPALANALGFVLIFGVCLLAGAIVGRLLSSVLRWTGLGWMDKLLGAGIGGARGLVVAVVLVLIMAAFPLKSPPKALRESHLAPYLLKAAHEITRLAPRDLRDTFDKHYRELRRLWEKPSGKRSLETQVL